MSNTDDFRAKIKTIKAQFPIKDVADWLGLTQRGARYFCPLCQTKGPQSHKTPDLALYNGVFKCWKCGVSGDHFDLIMQVMNVDFKTAFAFINDDNSGRRRPQFQCKKSALPSAELQGGHYAPKNNNWINHGHVFKLSQHELLKSPLAIDYLASRGFAIDDVKEFIGYLPPDRWINKKRDPPNGRIVFPHFSYQDPGKALNVYGRSCSPCADNINHDHGYGVKGFFSCKPARALASDTIMIVEGAFCALAVHCSAPLIPVAAIFGVHSFRFENFPQARRFIFALDQDKPGRKAFLQLADAGVLRGLEIFRLPLHCYGSCKDLAEAYAKRTLDITGIVGILNIAHVK